MKLKKFLTLSTIMALASTFQLNADEAVIGGLGLEVNTGENKILSKK